MNPPDRLPRPSLDELWGHLAAAIAALICFLGLLYMPGCSTVVPKPVTSQSASWDGNQQNSGILGVASAGYQVTAHFRDRYNALVVIYGQSKLPGGAFVFAPPLVRDAGLTPNPDGTWTIDREHMTDMVVLSNLKREGFKP